MSTDRFTEILNYLSAMSRDVGEFRRETTARFDGLDVRLSDLDGRMNSLDDRVSSLDVRMSSLDNRVSGLDDRVSSLDVRMSSLDGRMSSLDNRMSSLDKRMNNLETEMRAGFEDVRGDIRHLGHKLEIVTEDLMELRTSGRDLRKRMDVLERKQA